MEWSYIHTCGILGNLLMPTVGHATQQKKILTNSCQRLKKTYQQSVTHTQFKLHKYFYATTRIQALHMKWVTGKNSWMIFFGSTKFFIYLMYLTPFVYSTCFTCFTYLHTLHTLYFNVKGQMDGLSSLRMSCSTLEGYWVQDSTVRYPEGS